ncbi:MAG: MutS-related protein [Acetobacteraceae bacterium]
MKAFLMYPDRDFQAAAELSPFVTAAIQDLGLEAVFVAMAGDDKFLRMVAERAVTTSLVDPSVIRYRQDVLRDCLANETVVRTIYDLAIETIEKERKGFWGGLANHPSYLLHRAVEVLALFMDALRRLRAIAAGSGPAFQSAGFRRFFAMLRDELSDEYFATIERHLRMLRFRGGVLMNAGLGQGLKGETYTLRKPNDDEPGWIARIFGDSRPSYTYRLHPRDEAGARMLGELRDRGINLAANALSRSTDHILSFLKLLRTELAFYVGCINLRRALSGLGEPHVFPLAAPAEGRDLSARGLYDVGLALTMGKRVVGNTLAADGKSVLVVTGANQGGKSTFLRSLGLATLMMQCGMFVAAEQFSSAVCHGLFTHFKREEDASMQSGKLDEELARMSTIADHLEPHAMVLFNESFSATNEREGSEIARQILRALLEKKIRVCFVTHMYDFAHGVHESAAADALCLRAERTADGTRTFRLIEGEPLETSFGPDLYEKIFGSDIEPAAEPRADPMVAYANRR